MTDDPGASPLDRLAALRAEHKPILAAITSDPGMSATTRALLVEHLLEEEEERLAEAQRRGAGPSSKARATGADGRLTVGSLRGGAGWPPSGPARARETGPRRTVGDLRSRSTAREHSPQPHGRQR
jgi:hypothetical protein